MKRKALAITLAAAMAMGTCAVTASAADGDKYTIGICQLVQHEALDAATQGFKDEVTKELGEDAVTFDEQNAQGDSNTCSTIINSFVSNNVDLILANATPALQAAAAGTSDIPILGTSVTEYGVALGLDDFDGTSIEHYFKGKRIIYIMGVFADKDYRSVIQKTAHFADRILTIQTPDNIRAFSVCSL